MEQILIELLRKVERMGGVVVYEGMVFDPLTENWGGSPDPTHLRRDEVLLAIGEALFEFHRLQRNQAVTA